MTLKHTPGPWLIEKQRAPNGGTFWDITETDRQGHDRIAMVGPWMASRDGYIAEGNARLISSAPDMLAALQDLLADKYLSDPINSDRMAAARAAVTKAAGE